MFKMYVLYVLVGVAAVLGFLAILPRGKKRIEIEIDKTVTLIFSGRSIKLKSLNGTTLDSGYTEKGRVVGMISRNNRGYFFFTPPGEKEEVIILQGSLSKNGDVLTLSPEPTKLAA